MTSLDMQVRMLEKLGLKVEGCTPDEWLSLAIEAEDQARLCGPHDPAFHTLMVLRNNYERAAVVAELLVVATASNAGG